MPDRGLLAEILFPGRCLLCGKWLLFAGSDGSGDGSPVCGGCRADLEPLSGERCAVCSMPLSSERGACLRCRKADYAFDSNDSVFAYGGPVRQLISLYKFGGRTRLAGLFASYLAPVIGGKFPDRPVVPVPPRPSRRSADAVERILRLLTREHGLPVCRCLERTGGVPQKSLDFIQRAENLRGRIRVPTGRARAVVPAAAVLLDDVFTTGATADACARALRDAGCAAVAVVTIAID
jgi:predicted amidophosphoribosyltransferase